MNNFQMSDYDQRRVCRQGIFLLASHLNHSCQPNAYVHWNPSLQRLTVHAILDIQQGQEIVVDYQAQGDSFYQSSDSRRASLVRDYDFRCNCPACDQTSYHGRLCEGRRAYMSDLKQAIGNSDSDGDENARLQRRGNIEKLLKLLAQEERIYPQLADVYGQLAHWYLAELRKNSKVNGVAVGRWECNEKGKDAVRKRLQTDLLAVGVDSQELRDTLNLMGQFR